MRFNCHTHIFNFRAVFTPETIAILVDRLSREKWPEFATKAAEKILRKVVKGEMLDEDAILRELVSTLKADKALKKLLESGTAKLPPGLTLALEGNVADLPVDALREIMGKIGTALAAVDDKDIGRADLGDLLAFLAIGVKPSITAVARELLKQSGADTAVVALMMDITGGGDQDDALYLGQIEDTARAVRAFPGRVLPFVAVNPKRKLHFERMSFAVEERGAVGVKLYPSLGFAVDTVEMRRVYAYCEANEVPVLLHCNRGGFYRNKGNIEFCDPDAWKVVLGEHPGLKVCFGHFGGDENLIEPDIAPDSWTGRILALMRKHPGQVFADISYHDDPMDGGVAESNYFANLEEILEDAETRTQVLFGSDFHMVRQRVSDANLWRFFESRIKAPAFKRITETNPRAFLGMPRADGKGGGANIRRHLAYLAKHPTGVQEMPADWVLAGIQAEFGPVEFIPNEFGSDWTINNEAHFYTERFFRERLSSSDNAALSFTQVGHVRMRDLPNWPDAGSSATLRKDTYEQTTLRLIRYLTQQPRPAAKYESNIDDQAARAALLGLVSKPDSTIAAFGPVVDRLFRFKSEVS